MFDPKTWLEETYTKLPVEPDEPEDDDVDLYSCNKCGDRVSRSQLVSHDHDNVYIQFLKAGR